MTKLNFKTILPYLACLLIFAAISVAYFTPELLEGKVLFQGDTQQGIAVGHEAKIYQEATGEQTRWTNSLFSGMPTYQTAPSYGVRPMLGMISDLYRLYLPSPAGLIFIMMLGFFILMITLRVRKDLAVLGAIMYAFSSYFFIIIEAGHIWKFVTLAYIPPTIAGILLAYRGKYIAGAAMTALFAALQVYSNHVQMTYYFLFVILALVIGIFIDKYKNHRLPEFFKASGALVIAGILAVCVNLSNLYHTYEYSKQTMRGGSELVSKTNGNPAANNDGLEKEYITQWSYGKGETFSLLIPNVKGGATGALSQSKEAMKVAQPQYREYFAQFNQYWGDQPFTSGPVYVGAFVLFLFVLGLFIVKGWIKWSLLAVTVLTILLAWGKNFMVLTDLFIDYIPMYNKFRAVSSLLVVAEFCIPVLAILALKKIIEEPSILKTQARDFYISLGLTAGVALLFALFPTTFFSFMSEQEAAAYLPQAQQQPQMMDLLNNLMQGREAVFTADAWRTVIIILIGVAILYLYGKQKLKAGLTILLLGVLTLGDMWSVDKRYLNASNFVPKRQLSNPFPMSEADKQILQDKDIHYRVLNLSTNTFNDAATSYYHKSIGGYHAAKLQRYQDIIDRHLSGNINPNVVNMLNGKYYIVRGENGQPQAQLNTEALGNAWFVDRIDWVNTPDEEIDALNTVNPAHTAIIDKRFEKQLGAINLQPADSAATIRLTKYAPNELTYTTNNPKEGLALFSEVYYPGWSATIDGKPAEIVRADYILRAMVIPAGTHEVVMTFRPASISITDMISYIALGVIIFGGVLAIGANVTGFTLKKKGSSETDLN
ncbi:MAG: YfhO family protein [Bacteroidales bacterium]